jgi:hypothetical protein
MKSGDKRKLQDIYEGTEGEEARIFHSLKINGFSVLLMFRILNFG